MRKTSVYLPEETKAALHDLSRRWGRSEAELIREAIDRLVRAAPDAAAPSPSPAPERLRGPQLVGVGVGPSAPDLVTRRAVQVLERADRVFAAANAPDAIGRAEAIVRAVTPTVGVDRLAFGGGDDPVSRARVLASAADAVVAVLDRGAVAAFVTLGDPNVYSVFCSVADAVRTRRPGVPITTVPGIMAFQELAAATGTVLAEGREHLEIARLPDEPQALERALDDPDRTVVLYKGGRHLPAVAAELAARGRLDGAVVGELLGLPGGRSRPVSDVADRAASYLATVVVPARRSAES